MMWYSILDGRAIDFLFISIIVLRSAKSSGILNFKDEGRGDDSQNGVQKRG